MKNSRFRCFSKILIFVVPLSFTLISCSPSETIIEFRDLESSWFISKQISIRKKDEIKKRTPYFGKYDNKWLNFNVGGSYIDQISIINSPQELEFHFENQYFVANCQNFQSGRKYKYWDNFFISSEEIEKLKNKYNEEYFRTKILIINGGWHNTPILKIPKIKNSNSQITKKYFYEKVVSQNSFQTHWINDHYGTDQTAIFFDLIKKDYFDE